MPGFDGTGPLGQGPLTGGGKGFCVMPLGCNPEVPYGILDIQNNLTKFLYSYPPEYRGSYGQLYRYRPYPGRSSGYINRSVGYFRGRGREKLFFRGIAVKGLGRRF